jgi:hypothetical protein
MPSIFPDLRGRLLEFHDDLDLFFEWEPGQLAPALAFLLENALLGFIFHEGRP